MNKDSLRSWLAFLAFVFLYIPSTQLELLIAQPIVQAIGLVLGPFSGAPAHEVPPERLIGLCIIRVILVVAIMAIAARVDRRPMLSYGLDPIRLPEIAHGLLVGFLAVTAVVCGLYLSGHLHLTRGDGNIASRLLFGPIWAIGMILVGFSEELEFRGLPLLVLARVTSPAVACIVSAATFTLAHVQNSDETALGLLQIALFGGIAAISVMATGRLMWCIALHASWDWTLETFFGAIGSGYRFHGSFFKVDVSGPTWLTGGSAGLEGSVLAIAVLSLGLITSLLWWSRQEGFGRALTTQNGG